MADPIITVTIPPAYYSGLAEMLEKTVASFDPELAKLKPEQMKIRNSVALKRRGLIDLAYVAAGKNSEFIPPFMSFEGFSRNVGNMEEALRIRNALRQVEEHVRMLEIKSGNEAYQNALAIYGTIKFAARKGVLNAKAIYEKMKLAFRNCPRPHQASGNSSTPNKVANSADDAA